MNRMLNMLCVSLSLVGFGCVAEMTDGNNPDDRDLGEETAELASQFPKSIQNVWSGLCMDIPYGHAVNGQNVNEYPCHGGAAQQFVVEQLSLARNYQIRFQGTNLCVVPQGHTAPGFTPTNFWLVLTDCSHEFYSGWSKVNAHNVTYPWGTAEQTSFQRYDDRLYCMDAPGYIAGSAPSSFARPDPGWNNYPLQVYTPCHGGTTQRFDIRTF